ncbi:MAG TPA: non-homologous end-joining DNA ligase, partial [Candidatus Binatia bacterium]|nr:non-homologous end-joining DNA ligase [Candidatus Binatia bacterium]
MSLDAYRRKRDFRRTPEPPGAPGGDGGSVGGRFVVQRHRARRLHYDLRLEIGGVLVSWAVPKGPTLDPGARRMAIRVEDHPIEYLDFEGVIPAGEYGAGDVIVWDRGTWEPEPETPDPERALAAGELKFRLRGEKLAGRFVLVRTARAGPRPRGDARTERDRPDRDRAERDRAESGEGGGEAWLLIKKRDEHAVPGWDPEEHPRSVKTGRTNDEVRAASDTLWAAAAGAAEAEIDLSAAVAVEAPPTFIPPMLASLADEPFDDPDWLFEVKWDGFRVEAIVTDGAVRLFTRNGHDAAAYFPRLLPPPDRWLRAREAILDGEVVALDPAGRPDFDLLQGWIAGDAEARRAPIVYEVFDLLRIDGRSLLAVPLEDRKRLLRAILLDGPRVRYAGHVAADGRAFFEAARNQGLEGIVAKRRRSPYEPGRRSPNWLKLKARLSQELVVGGWLPGQGRARDLGALLVGVYEGDRLRYAGRVGSGFDAAARRRLRHELEALAADAPPFEPAPEPRGPLAAARWVRPRLVIRAEIGGWTREGLVRQASYKGLELDRDPRDVVRERPGDAAVLRRLAAPE